jgi:hypothetical protein
MCPAPNCVCDKIRSAAAHCHPAPSRALARRGLRALRHPPAGRNDPRSVARRPHLLLRHRTGHAVLRHLKRPAAPQVRLYHPLFSVPQPSGGQLLTSEPTFVTLRPWKRTLSASDSGPTPRRAKSDFVLLQYSTNSKRVDMANNPNANIPTPSAPTWQNWSANLVHKPASDGGKYYFAPANLTELKSVLPVLGALPQTPPVLGEQ